MTAVSQLILATAVTVVPVGSVGAMAPAVATACVAGATGIPTGRSLREGDPGDLSVARVRRFEQRTDRRIDGLAGPTGRAAQRVDPPPVGVDVAVHVVRRRTDAFEVGRRRARHAVALLTGGFAGAQDDSAYATSFRFRMSSFDSTVNRAWYHADVSNVHQRPAVREMKRTLHVGGPETLNLYLTRPDLLLGWATFPQQYSRHPRLDGVVVTIGSLAGGDLSGYDLGDTVTHEVGHWLGLYHTFQGGCSPRNDRVGDTAAEASPNFGCPVRRDTCTVDTLLDPIHNFMDYSRDSCMYAFTGGQDQRMLRHWLAYRV